MSPYLVEYSLPLSASEMTYIVSSGALNSTHSLTLTTACCLVVGLGLDLANGWLVVMHTYLYYFPLQPSLSQSQLALHTQIQTLGGVSGVGTSG